MIHPIFTSDIEQEILESHTWQSIDHAFSVPISHDARDETELAEYAATQVLAETFQEAGFDGLRYGSILGGGASIALFELSSAQIVERQVHMLESVSMEFEQISDIIHELPTQCEKCGSCTCASCNPPKDCLWE